MYLVDRLLAHICLLLNELEIWKSIGNKFNQCKCHENGLLLSIAMGQYMLMEANVMTVPLQTLLKNMLLITINGRMWAVWTPRRLHAACVMNGKIFVVGGLDASGEAVKAIECYCQKTDSWKVVGRTEEKVFHHAIVALWKGCKIFLVRELSQVCNKEQKLPDLLRWHFIFKWSLLCSTVTFYAISIWFFCFSIWAERKRIDM